MKYLFLCVILLVIEAKAFRLEPMTADFSSSGDGSVRDFRIVNDSKDEIAVNVRAYLREMSINGKEKRTPTTDFKISPVQFALMPNYFQTIRVTYQGAPLVDSEVPYRIIATQLPVYSKNRSKEKGIRSLFQYIASVYVTSDRFDPKFEVEAILQTEEDGMKVTLVNNGKKHRKN